MSDVTHARAAEAYLKEVLEQSEIEAHPADLALVHASLASARALREVDNSVRLGFKNLIDRTKGAPPADMVYLESPDGAPVWFNVRQFRSVTGDPDDPGLTRVDVGGMVHTVKGSVVDVSATIFQVVGSW